MANVRDKLFQAIAEGRSGDFFQCVSDEKITDFNLVDTEGKFFTKHSPADPSTGTTLIAAAAFWRRSQIVDFLIEKKVSNILVKNDLENNAIRFVADPEALIKPEPIHPELAYKLIFAAFCCAEEKNDEKEIKECQEYIKKYADIFRDEDCYNLGWMLAGGKKHLAIDNAEAKKIFTRAYDKKIHADKIAIYFACYRLHGLGGYTKNLSRASEFICFSYDSISNLDSQDMDQIVSVLDRIAKAEDSKEHNTALDKARLKLVKHYLTSDEKKSEEYAQLISDGKLKTPWVDYFAAKRMIREGDQISAVKLLGRHPEFEEAKKELAVIEKSNDTIAKCLLKIELFKKTKDATHCKDLPNEWQIYFKAICALEGLGEFQKPDFIEAISLFHVAQVRGVLLAYIDEMNVLVKLKRVELAYDKLHVLVHNVFTPNVLNARKTDQVYLKKALKELIATVKPDENAVPANRADDKDAKTMPSQLVLTTDLIQEAEKHYDECNVPAAIKAYRAVAEAAKISWGESEINKHRNKFSKLSVIATAKQKEEMAAVNAIFTQKLEQIKAAENNTEEAAILEAWGKAGKPKEYLPRFDFYFKRASEEEGIATTAITQSDEQEFVKHRKAAIDFYVKAHEFASKENKLILESLMESYTNETHNRATETDKKKNNSDVISYAAEALQKMRAPNVSVASISITNTADLIGMISVTEAPKPAAATPKKKSFFSSWF